MKCKVTNKSDLDFDQFKPLLTSFMNFATQRFGFEEPPSLFFMSDPENAKKPLGKTAHYDPNSKEVTIYTDKRHPKDILRSLSHELVHHKQNCKGQLDEPGDMGLGYAQTNPRLRQAEWEANGEGSMCLRDWEDTYKKQLQESNYYFKGNKKMNTKDWSRKELNTLLMERWGYKEGSDKEGGETVEDPESEELGDVTIPDVEGDGLPDLLLGDLEEDCDDGDDTLEESRIRKAVRLALKRRMSKRK
jgi:hypothetical protein